MIYTTLSCCRCHSCKADEIIVTNNSTNEKECKKCPANHIVVDSYTCRACGHGLVSSTDSKECVSDCMFQSADGMSFDFSKLEG